MESNRKMSVLRMFYYLAIAIMGVYSVIFGIFLANTLTVVWARIAYFIWLALIVVAVAYDVYCLVMRKSKYISGVALVIITIVTIAASIVLYSSFATEGVILAPVLFGYISSVFLSYFINGMALCVYFIGEKFSHREA